MCVHVSVFLHLPTHVSLGSPRVIPNHLVTPAPPHQPLLLSVWSYRLFLRSVLVVLAGGFSLHSLVSDVEHLCNCVSSLMTCCVQIFCHLIGLFSYYILRILYVCLNISTLSVTWFASIFPSL